MCIIQGEVETVKNTKILVAPMAGDLQLTVYSNKVRLGADAGAMVLPFPGSECLPFDLSAYKDLFKDLNNAVWPKTLSKGFRSRGMMTLSTNSLEVLQVGSYKASVVPTLDDFSRLDAEVFKIDPRVHEFLKTHYPNLWGFVVCQLDHDKEYHPFGYITQRAIGGSLFMPTRHWHEHKASKLPPSANTSWGSNSWGSNSWRRRGTDDTKEEHEHGNPGDSADWDHEIYSVNFPLDVDQRHRAVTTTSQRGDYMRSVKWNLLPPTLDAPRRVYSAKINSGYNANHDIFCTA
jgi:hypothetical protein